MGGNKFSAECSCGREKRVEGKIMLRAYFRARTRTFQPPFPTMRLVLASPPPLVGLWVGPSVSLSTHSVCPLPPHAHSDGLAAASRPSCTNEVRPYILTGRRRRRQTATGGRTDAYGGSSADGRSVGRLPAECGRADDGDRGACDGRTDADAVCA